MKKKYLLVAMLVIIFFIYFLICLNNNLRYGDYPHHGPSPSSYFSSVFKIIS